MVNSKITSKIIFSDNFRDELNEITGQFSGRKIFLATESSVDRLWVSKLSDLTDNRGIRKIVLPAGEENKKIDSATAVWKFLSENGADRKSLLINIGGGMLTDLGGFAASTFKRGIEFINVPTTLLSQVDASVGGKTGINFNGLKNEVGTFQEASAVIIDSHFLETLDPENFLSGFAEMIKHGLIKSPEHLEELKVFSLIKPDYHLLKEIIRHSVTIKEYFVSHDPTEKNIRKALNFGHTTGHAIESLAMEHNRPVLHGYAVAYGMMTEMYLSVKKCGFPAQTLDILSSWIKKIYSKFELQETDFTRIYEFMTHDKKNEAGKVNFTLLSSVGQMQINQECSRKLIFEALDYYRSL